MNSLETTFNRLRAQGRAALMPFITMGFPRRESAFELVPALVDGGADIIELGVPFSDPLADGATVQAASQQALQNGMTLARCLDQAAELRSCGVRAPFVLMGYYNPIFQMGEHTFAQRAAEAGIQGVIVPDLPPEEGDTLQATLRAHGLDLIFLLAPTSDETRVKLVARRASGFIYLVSLTGVTGARDQLPPDLEKFVARVRRATSLPLAVGFGIARPEHAAHVARVADGVIVGSALLKVIETASNPVAAARQFVAELRAGIEAARAARPDEFPRG